MKNTDITKLIHEKYSASFMNDSKWQKLLDLLAMSVDEIFINYKLIYSNEIYSTVFTTSHSKPFFKEPIVYKEVEWIEFPQKFTITVNERASRKINKIVLQDMFFLEYTINKSGDYVFDKNDNAIRLYAYR